MPTPVFLTVDTELAWRHHAAALDPSEIVARSLDPAGVGIAYQLDRLARHGLKACFFVDPMPALVFGLDWLKPLVEAVLAARQEVQLHLHPNWAGAQSGDGGAAHARFELVEYTAHEQRELIAGATDLLKAAGAPHPIAFRAGSYAANDDTLAALAACGFAYDSSHNGAAAPWPSAIGLRPTQIAPVVRAGLIELPVTLIEDAPGSLRNFQVCALSIGEIRAALDHAVAESHSAVTIVSHSFELANRAGTRPNGIHVRRFDALCDMLRSMRDALPTQHFSDRSPLGLDAADQPLAPSALRTRWRQAEQLWSNMVEERAA
jgi:peptidoglycan/xylan/chitin deacetylase (PgdA/CDA1 family)